MNRDRALELLAAVAQGQLAPDAAFEYCYLHDVPKVAGALLAAGGPEAWLAGFRQRVRETKMRGDARPTWFRAWSQRVRKRASRPPLQTISAAR